MCFRTVSYEGTGGFQESHYGACSAAERRAAPQIVRRTTTTTQ